MASFGAVVPNGDRLNLFKLSDANVADIGGIEDTRGRKVIDIHGESFGHIADLLIDLSKLEVRFLIVEPCEPLSLTHTSLLIPVDALTGDLDDAVFIDCACEHVADSPHCYPDLIDSFYIEEVYSYYGYGCLAGQ